MEKSYIFDSSVDLARARLVLLSVPWSVTQSGGGGADKGPEMIQKVSSQMDFFSLRGKDARKQGIHLKPPPDFLTTLNRKMREKALPILALEEKAPGPFSPSLTEEINRACSQMVDWVFEEAKTLYKRGKKIGLIGGDHSVSEGILRFLGEEHKGDFGVLHIDAHADLRKSYQGFRHSHASVMYNVMNQGFPPLALVQVGVRDFSEEEYQRIKSHKNIHTFFDEEIKSQMFKGRPYADLVDSVLSYLPEKVYVSLDVDGLCPSLFPQTGTPVPGGLSFSEVVFLLNKLRQKHKVIGFDLVEVAEGERAKGELTELQGLKMSLDAINGAYLLYKLCEII